MLGLVIYGGFQDYRDVVRFDLDTGKLVGVKGGQKCMLIYLVMVYEMPPFRLRRD